MKVLQPRCAKLDVHKDEVVACVCVDLSSDGLRLPRQRPRR